MELSRKASMLCCLLLYMVSTVNSQGGGVAIGMGGGAAFGELPSPFQTGPGPVKEAPIVDVPTQAPVIVTSQGGGFNPLDALANTGGPYPTTVGDTAGTSNINPSQPNTGPSSSTGKQGAQIDPATGTEFTLQNEPYTPLGSVGHLVKVPTTRNEGQGTNGDGVSNSSANMPIDDVIVKPESTLMDAPKPASNNDIATEGGAPPFPQTGSVAFNPGSGAADEIAALQSSSSMAKPVDMSNFIPPPYIPIGSQEEQIGSTNDKSVADKVPLVSNVPNANQNEAVNVQAVTNSVQDKVVDVPALSNYIHDNVLDVLATPNTSQNVPVNVPDIPNASQNVPVNVPDIPNASQNVPVNVPDIPNASQNVPVNVPDIPNASQNVLVNVPDFPNESQNVPVNVPDIPNASQNVPVNVPDIPNASQNVPINVPAIPNASQNVPVNVPDIPNGSQNVPINVPAIPNASQNVLVNVPDFPNESQNVPVNVPDIPNESQNVPVNVPDIPNESQNVPVNVPDIPNASQNVPVNVPDIPNASQNVPINVPAIPNASQNVPVNVPDIPNASQNVPVNVPDIPNASQNVPVNVPDIPNASQNVPVNVPDIPNESQNVPVNVPDIPNASQNVPVNVPDIPNASQNVPVNVPDIPNASQNVPINVPDIPNASQNVPVNVPDIPNASQNVPINVPDIPNASQNVPVNVPAIPNASQNVPVNVPYVPNASQNVPVNVPELPTANKDLAVNIPNIPNSNQNEAVNIPAIVNANQNVAVDVPEIQKSDQGVAVNVPAVHMKNTDIPFIVPDISNSNQNIEATVASIPDVNADLPANVPIIPNGHQNSVNKLPIIKNSIQEELMNMPPIPIPNHGVPVNMPDIPIVNHGVSSNVQDRPSHNVNNTKVVNEPIIPNPYPNKAVNVPIIPNLESNTQIDTALNNILADSVVGSTKGERKSLREMFSRPKPLTQNMASPDASPIKATEQNSLPGTISTANVNSGPGQAKNSISAVKSNVPSSDVPPAIPIPTQRSVQNKVEEPHLQDMTAEGIYPFEGSSVARDATLTESKGVIKDMNQAIASHNTAEKLHLENTLGGMNDVPLSLDTNTGPITGTNGGPITNLVGVKPPKPMDGQNQGPASNQLLNTVNERTNNKVPGSFIIGAGMPNAQVVQTGLVSDTVSSNTNNAGGVALGGGNPDMSGISLPNRFMSPPQQGNVQIPLGNTPLATDMTNMVPPPYTPVDNVPVDTANTAQRIPDASRNNAFNNILNAPLKNTPKFIPDVTHNQPSKSSINPISNIQRRPIASNIIVPPPYIPADNVQAVAPIIPDASQNQALNKPFNNFKMFAPSTQGKSISSLNQAPQSTNNLPPTNEVPMEMVRNEMIEASLVQQPATGAGSIDQPMFPDLAGNFRHSNTPMNIQVQPPQQPESRSTNKRTQVLTDQQIINVKPGWITNIFGSIGNNNANQGPVDAPIMTRNVPEKSNIADISRPLVESGITTNNVEPYPKTQTVVNTGGGNIANNAPGLPSFGFVDNAVRKPDPVQIVPLNNKPPVSNPGNDVFTLGAHRVIHELPSGQQPRGNFADYLTQNMIGTADTKPLVSVNNAQMNNIQMGEPSPNSVESQLKRLMVLQDAQLASSGPQGLSQGSGSVKTSFEAPGMSVGRSIAVQEQFNRQPNVVSITAGRNVPVQNNNPSLVQQPVAGGINDVSGMKTTQNQNELSFQFGLTEPRPNDASSQLNMFRNIDPVINQAASEAIITRDQNRQIDFGTGTGQNAQTASLAIQQSNANTLDTFANGLRIGQPVAFAADIKPAAPNTMGLMLPMNQQVNMNMPLSGQQSNNILPVGPNAETTKLTSGTRQAIFGGNAPNMDQTQRALQQLTMAGGNTRPMVINSGNEYPLTDLGTGNQGINVDMRRLQMQKEPCMYVEDPMSSIHFYMQIRESSVMHRFRCALGTAFDPVSCECSQRIVDTGACLEVHMDFNNGIVEDSSSNKLPIGNQNVEVTNQSTPLSGIALFNSNSKLTIWRYQNYDFRDDVMLKVQFRPGQAVGDRFQPLIGNCDGSIDGPSIAIVYDSLKKEVILVLKTVNATKQELSFPINAQEWNDVTYIYDGREFIGIVNGVRRYVSRTNPRLLGIIGGDIKSVPARGLIEIRDAGIILGHCPRYGYYNGAMVDIQIYTCIPKDFRLE